MTAIDCTLFGAIDVLTHNHVLPVYAIKGREYVCPNCEESVCFKKGGERRPHFSHKAGAQCTYYMHCNESNIHKEAKWRLACALADDEIKTVQREGICPNCIKYDKPCLHEVVPIKTALNDTVEIEYRDGKYSYDVAVLDDKGQIKYVFEIYYKHKTENPRPEPWFEVSAEAILKGINGHLFCTRKPQCNCLWAYNRYEWMSQWPLHTDVGCCLMCGSKQRSAYGFNPQPQILANVSKAVCSTCLRGHQVYAVASFLKIAHVLVKHIVNENRVHPKHLWRDRYARARKSTRKEIKWLHDCTDEPEITHWIVVNA